MRFDELRLRHAGYPHSMLVFERETTMDEDSMWGYFNFVISQILKNETTPIVSFEIKVFRGPDVVASLTREYYRQYRHK